MNAEDAVVPLEPVQREGQGQSQDSERPLLRLVVHDAVLKVERTDRRGGIPSRITALSDSNGAATFGPPVTGDCDARGSGLHPGNIPVPPGKLHTVTGVAGAPALALPPPTFGPGRPWGGS